MNLPATQHSSAMSRLAGRIARVCATLAFGLVGLVAAEGDQGTAQDLLVDELRFALETAHRRIGDLERRLEQHGPTASPDGETLVAALAAANREAEQYRVRYRDLLVRVESLGLATIRSDKALEDRLIKAVRERQLYLEKHQASQEQIMRLSEAVLNYVKHSTTAEPQARLRLEAELRKSDDLLGFGSAKADGTGDAREISEGRVIGYKNDLRLAVIDVGSRSGVKVGTPLNIIRKDRIVGTALVVDVRDSLAGALVQEIFREGDRIEVQDRVEPRTAGSLKL